MKKAACIVLPILILALGIFVGYVIWGARTQTSSPDSYNVLRDTISIVLVVIAVGIAVFGYSVYLVISWRLKAEATLASHVESLKSFVQLYIVSGYTYWENYAITGKKKPKYLDVAINHTESALQAYNELPESEAKKRENEVYYYLIKNNLAYYFAERKKPEDADIAKEYAEYIRKGLTKYPKERGNWLDTYNFVYQQYQD